MNTRVRILSITVFLGALAASCTTETIEDDQGAPCNDVGQCLPGWICAQGRCLEGTTGGQGPNSVGPNGGIVNGPNGTQIEIPTGALGTNLELTLTSHSQNLNIDNLQVLAPLVEIGPVDAEFSLEATVVIPVDTSSTSLKPSDIAIYHGSSLQGPWEKLYGASSSTLAIGLTTKLGFFAAGASDN